MCGKSPSEQGCVNVSLCGCYAVWIGIQLSKFRNIVVPSSWGSGSEYLLGLSTLKMAALRSFETLVTIYQFIRRDIPRDLNCHDLILLRRIDSWRKQRPCAGAERCFFHFLSPPLIKGDHLYRSTFVFLKHRNFKSLYLIFLFKFKRWPCHGSGG